MMSFSKLLFLLNLKTPGTASLDGYLTTSTHPALTLYLLNALIIRGSMKGYNQLKALLMAEPVTLASLFGRIVAKSRDHYLTKEHGFNNVFKLYKQRLFSTLYPGLLELVRKEASREAVELMMHNCSLVSIASLQDKLPELIPIAE